MKRILMLAAASFVVLATLLFQAACGSSSNPVSPVPGGGGGGSANVVIGINGIAGSNSFSPNPATAASGQTVAWKNNDPANTHHIVADNGSFDAGVTPPGATSSLVMPGSGAVSYHCTFHPSMVGSINGSTAGGPTGPGY